jgi:DNA-binding phage protein
MAKGKSMVDVLRSAIKASGLTHYRLAKEAGIKPFLLDRFVSREGDLRLETAAKVAEVLGLELRKRDS